MCFGRTCLLLLAVLLSPTALAALEARIDRDRVALGDSLELVVVATEGEDVADIDLAPLQQDFVIMGRSTRSSMSITNGRRESTTELIMQISPRRSGSLTVPILAVDGQRTRPLSLQVGPAPDSSAGDTDVFFEAVLDREETWVQGQVILTLRLHQAVNLEARSISELKLDTAYVHTLEQNSFQRQVNGRPFLITEIRYALFPEQSGELVIPAQTFSGRETRPRRSLFDNNSGRLISRSTEPVSIEVKSRPQSFPAGSTWLPARDLVISEQWSSDPEQLAVGESVTRTLSLNGYGLQGAQLPPMEPPSLPGLKIYPDQPDISDGQSSDGLIGRRSESAAFIATEPGNYTLPELRIPWWDTNADTLRWAILPARNIMVTGSAVTQPATEQSTSQAPTTAPGPSSSTVSPNLWLWQWVAVISSAGWLVTLFVLWRRPASQTVARSAPVSGGEKEKALFAELERACQNHDARAARQALGRWASTQPGFSTRSGLQGFAESHNEAALSAALSELDACLYRSETNTPWRGDALLASLKSVRNQPPASHNPQDGLSLYPE